MPRARAKPAVTYLLVAFGVAWVAWIYAAWAVRDVSAGVLLAVVIAGSFGPFVGASVAVAAAEGLPAVPRFYARALRWRMGWGVFLTSVLLLPVLGVAVSFIFLRVHHAAFNLQMGWGNLPLAYVWLFVLGGALGEEFGWSYLADRLDGVAALVPATLLLGVVWALWHLPLFFLDVPGLTQKYLPLSAFLAMTVALRFLFSWGYHKGGRSVLCNLLYHNSMNFAFSLAPVVSPVVGDPQWRLWLLSGAAAAAAAGLWRWAPPGGLAWRSKRSMG